MDVVKVHRYEDIPGVVDVEAELRKKAEALLSDTKATVNQFRRLFGMADHPEGNALLSDGLPEHSQGRFSKQDSAAVL